jgi:hypothetical protein
MIAAVGEMVLCDDNSYTKSDRHWEALAQSYQRSCIDKVVDLIVTAPALPLLS